jgi:DNA-binding transcriptional regulator GbsR (MarR family)
VAEQYARDFGIDPASAAHGIRKKRVSMGKDRLSDDDLVSYGNAPLKVIAVGDRHRDFVEAQHQIIDVFGRASAESRRRAIHPFASTVEGLSEENAQEHAAQAACEALGIRLEACRESRRFCPF